MQVTYIKNKSIKQITQVIGDEMETYGHMQRQYHYKGSS